MAVVMNQCGLRRCRRTANLTSRARCGGVVTKNRENGNQPTAPKAWGAMREQLMKAGVKSVTPSDAASLQKKGYTVVDIRTGPEYAEGRALGAVSAPLYRPIKEWDAWSNLRRAGFAFFGIFNGTEESPDFLEDAESALEGKKEKVVLYCGTGGTMEESVNLKLGQQSRSLIAASELLEAGYTDIVHMLDGYYGWCKADLPLEADE